MNNPFRLDFGAVPKLYIARSDNEDVIINTFTNENPSVHIYLITGARGMGKTVLMTAVSEQIKKEKDWLHIDVSSEHVMTELYSYLMRETGSKFSDIKISANANLGLANIGLSATMNGDKNADIKIEIKNILEEYKKKNKKLLLTIDEVGNTAGMREFATFFQQCIRSNYPIFVLMTGLYKNVRALENNKTLTFLKRAPKIQLKPLNQRRVVREYQEVFDFSHEELNKLAKATKGYAYAFQILGYLLCESDEKKLTDKIIDEYKLDLYEKCYDKIWEELSNNEQRIVAKAASLETPMVATIKKDLDIDSNNFSTYQNNLLKYGIITDSSAYGKMEFSLPFFKEFVLDITDDFA